MNFNQMLLFNCVISYFSPNETNFQLTWAQAELDLSRENCYFSEMADKRVDLLGVLYQIELGSIAKWMISAYAYKY